MLDKSLIRPSAIEWRITGRCNEECAYCYGPRKSVHPEDATVRSILEILIRSETEIIRFSGGEPLIYSDIASVIRDLALAGKRVVLSTNGLRFVNLRRELDPYLAKLNISLDGYDARTHSLCGRTPIGFERAVAALDSVSMDPPHYMVKVGTVVTSKSARETDILNLTYELLIGRRVNRWKIYQYVPEGPIVDLSLRVTDDVFNELKTDLETYIASRIGGTPASLIVEFASAESRSGAYFIIEPLGEVIVPIGNGASTEEVHIGNVLDTPLSILYSRWAEIADARHHFLNNFVVRCQAGWGS